MQSAMMTLVRQRGCAPKTFNGTACAVVIGWAGFAITASPAAAFVSGAGNSLQQQLKQDSPIIEVVVRRGGAVRRTTVVGPRGNVASRTVVRRGAVVRPGVVRPGGWVRPAHHYWRPGGAIAAGGCPWICRRGLCCSGGGIATGARLLLVLHRSEPDSGLLGRLPVIAHVGS